MKWFDYYKEWDYGFSGYFTLGQFENFNILDVSFFSSSYWSWEPNIRLTVEVLAGTLFTIKFSAWSFSFDLDFISYRCPCNLSYKREL